MSIYNILYSSPIGTMALSSDDAQLLQMSFCANADASLEIPNTPPLKAAVKWLDSYFSGHPLPISEVPIFLSGSQFQIMCWQELQSIPYGQTITYKDLANRMAACKGVQQMSCQAVGQAIRKNPFAILVPCHRVIGSDGTLTGYAWGLERKLQLLLLEKEKVL